MPAPTFLRPSQLYGFIMVSFWRDAEIPTCPVPPSYPASYIVRPGANRKGKTIFENGFCGRARSGERVKVTSSL